MILNNSALVQKVKKNIYLAIGLLRLKETKKHYWTEKKYIASIVEYTWLFGWLLLYVNQYIILSILNRNTWTVHSPVEYRDNTNCNVMFVSH